MPHRCGALPSAARGRIVVSWWLLAVNRAAGKGRTLGRKHPRLALPRNEGLGVVSACDGPKLELRLWLALQEEHSAALGRPQRLGQQAPTGWRERNLRRACIA